MPDRAHEWTDERIEELADRMREVYSQAAEDMRAKLDDWLRDYERKNARWREDVEAGVRTQAEYSEWLRRRAADEARQREMIDDLTADAVNADVRARQLINDEVPTVLAENANWEAFDIDRQIGVDTNFTLYNQDSVRLLVNHSPELLPQLDVAADIRWSRQKVASAIAQSILQGETVEETADRLRRVVGMGEAASLRAARTAMTYAEARGRGLAIDRAERMGVPMFREWEAIMDGRTRLSHRQAHGQRVRGNQRFIVGGSEMMCPGDPSAPGEEVYNCRCAVVGQADYEGISPLVYIRHSKLPKGVTEEQWRKGRYVTNKNDRETNASKRERGVPVKRKSSSKGSNGTRRKANGNGKGN